jgi:trehalose/maltose hydrolase-like predicted phosphorylase
MDDPFDVTEPPDPWVLRYDTWDPAAEPTREALCTVGNGYFATRGAAPEQDAGPGHYPGTYVAGVYNRLRSTVADRELEHESLVNTANWLPLTWRVDGGEWFSIDDVEVDEFSQFLDLRRGMLTRKVRFSDGAGRTTSMVQSRIVHMGQPHLGFLRTAIRAEDWSGRVEFRSLVDGGVRNHNVARYRALSSRHLETLGREEVTDDMVLLRSRTVQSRVELCCAMRTTATVDGDPVAAPTCTTEGDDVIGSHGSAVLVEGATMTIEKAVAIFTSRDRAISEPGLAATSLLARTGSMADSLATHEAAWVDLWRRFEVDVRTDRTWVPTAVNVHLFHLLQTTSPNTIDLDVGIPARGLHGEAYRGHIFWDEMFVFPMLHNRVPEVARALLKYRHRRLDEARAAARALGHRGAMFPWQSGSDGREETDSVHLNPRSGNWIPDKSRRQRHIGLAIAFSVWRFHQVTQDLEFLTRYGAELLIEIARFFASLATHDPARDRWEIVGVMGPDEFQESDPNREGDGLRNNAYTNVMASWLLRTAAEVLDPLPRYQRLGLMDRLAITEEEVDSWVTIGTNLVVPTHGDGIISQFEGYEDLLELDWEAYRERYDDIQRLDRIMEAEGDSANRYKASKQADVLMLFYLFSFEELSDLFATLGVDFDADVLDRNVAYYLARTSHGSTLSRIVHSWVLARTDRRRSAELLDEALASDIEDIQGGTTQEGIHLGAMAGTVDLIQRGYSGMETLGDELRFKPSLPPEIERLAFRIFHRHRWLVVILEDDTLTLTSEDTDQGPITVVCRGERALLGSGETRTFTRSRTHEVPAGTGPNGP